MLRGVPHRSSRPRARAEARHAQRDRRCLLGLTDCACVAHDREGALAEVAVRRVDWHGSTSTTSAPVGRLPADGDERPGRKGPTLPPGTASVSPPESDGVAPRPKSVRALAPCVAPALLTLQARALPRRSKRHTPRSQTCSSPSAGAGQKGGPDGEGDGRWPCDVSACRVLAELRHAPGASAARALHG